MRDHVESVAGFTHTPIDLAGVWGSRPSPPPSVDGSGRVNGPWIEPTNLFIGQLAPAGLAQVGGLLGDGRPLYLAEKALIGELTPAIMEAETIIAIEEAKIERAKKDMAKPPKDENGHRRGEGRVGADDFAG